MIKEQIDILKEVFEEWLQIHDLDYDFWIYSGDASRLMQLPSTRGRLPKAPQGSFTL